MNLSKYETRNGVMVPKAIGYDVVLPNLNRRQVGISTWTMPVDEDRLVGWWDLQRLRLECNHAIRNRPTARAIHDRIIDGVVGTDGIRHEASTSDPKWNKLADDYMTERDKIWDYRQRCKSIVEADQLCIHHILTDGGLFFLRMENGQEQPIEADRVCTPEKFMTDESVVNGARVGAGGIIIGWYVCDRNSRGHVDRSKFEYVESQYMIHVGNPFRVDQIAPIPMMAPSIAKLIDLDEMEQSMLLKAKAEAKRAGAFYSNSATGGPGTVPDRLAGFGTTAGREANRGLTYETVNSLEFYYPMSSEKLDSLEPKTPGQYHIEYCNLVFDECCAAMGVAPEWVKLKYNTSYIASRGALVTTEPTIQRLQGTLETKFRQRRWNWKISTAIRKKELPPSPKDENGRPEWFKVFWHWPPMVALDRADEAGADAREYQNRTSTLGDLHQRRGGNFERWLRKHVDECRQILRAAGHPDSTPIPLWMMTPAMNSAVPPDATGKDRAGAQAAEK